MFSPCCRAQGFPHIPNTCRTAEMKIQNFCRCQFVCECVQGAHYTVTSVVLLCLARTRCSRDGLAVATCPWCGFRAFRKRPNVRQAVSRMDGWTTCSSTVLINTTPVSPNSCLSVIHKLIHFQVISTKHRL